jgi:hypothetical protein
MARLTRIDTNGKLQVLSSLNFESDPVWRSILGTITSPECGPGEGIAPESESVLQRLIELYPGILPWSS